jgi:DNA-binding transcriptional ArsR family regulator
MPALSKTFAALADDTRLSLVETLMQRGELPAGALLDIAPISGPAISRHLKILRQAGLVQARVNGPQRLYSVRPEALQTISRWTQSRLDFWQQSLERLDQHLARKKE